MLTAPIGNVHFVCRTGCTANAPHPAISPPTKNGSRSAVGASAEAHVSGTWGATNSTTAQIPAGGGVVELMLPAAASDIKLWWPRGYGRGQPLYAVNATVVVS